MLLFPRESSWKIVGFGVLSQKKQAYQNGTLVEDKKHFPELDQDASGTPKLLPDDGDSNATISDRKDSVSRLTFHANCPLASGCGSVW